jgi:hypothetical protein
MSDTQTISEFHSPVGIVLPPVWAHVFLTTARLLKYSFEDLGVRAETVEYDGYLHYDWSVVIGWSLFEEPFPKGCRYVLYQLEPLCLQHWQQRLVEKQFLFEEAVAIWDYSEMNLPYLRGLPVQWVPLGYHPRLREVKLRTHLQEYDVLFVGFGSPWRRDLLERLANRCSLSMQPRWGSDFRAALASTKMVLNVHQYDVPTPLEQPRVAYVLNQGGFVLTENSADDPYPWLPTAQYDELIDQALYYLYHPIERRKRQQAMFDKFASMPMARAVAKSMPTVGGSIEG